MIIPTKPLNEVTQQALAVLVGEHRRGEYGAVLKSVHDGIQRVLRNATRFSPRLTLDDLLAAIKQRPSQP